jgi:hypothetical protein
MNPPIRFEIHSPEHSKGIYGSGSYITVHLTSAPMRECTRACMQEGVDCMHMCVRVCAYGWVCAGARLLTLSSEMPPLFLIL